MNKPRNFFSSFNKKRINKESGLFKYKEPWLMVRDWYASDLGQALLSNEQLALEPLLEQIFGYNLIQLGCLDNSSKNKGLTDKSRVSHQFVFESLGCDSQVSSATQLISNFEQLPVQNHSVDAIILPHTLEFEPNPHQILREVERVLVAEGKAIFLGFNPYGLWGMWHKYWELKKHISANTHDKNGICCQVPLPSCGHLISQKRLRDWLKLLGFDIELVSEYFYRPPISSSVLLRKLEFMEQAGQFSKILPAGGYLIVATKRVSTLTPIRQRWKLTNRILTPNTIETAGMKLSIFATKAKPSQIKDKGTHGKK